MLDLFHDMGVGPRPAHEVTLDWLKYCASANVPLNLFHRYWGSDAIVDFPGGRDPVLWGAEYGLVAGIASRIIGVEIPREAAVTVCPQMIAYLEVIRDTRSTRNLKGILQGCIDWLQRNYPV